MHQTIQEKLVGTIPDPPKAIDHPVVPNQLIENHGAVPPPTSSGTARPRGGEGGAASTLLSPDALKLGSSPEAVCGFRYAHTPQITEWSRHHVMLEVFSPQFHTTLAVGNTAPMMMELAKNMSPGPVRPAGREADIPQVHAMNARQKLEPKRQGVFNPPFKPAQTYEFLARLPPKFDPDGLGTLIGGSGVNFPVELHPPRGRETSIRP